MNTRDYKMFAPGCYYHVYNRGNAKELVFKDDEDYRFYLYRLKENMVGQPLGKVGRYVRRVLPVGAFTLVAYCLMPNHFHLLIRQNTQIPVHELLLRLSTGYSKYFNKKYNRVGHVFQDQFKAILVDTDEYLLWLAAYIHANPVVGNLTALPEAYSWSNYPDMVGIRSGTLCESSIILKQFKSGAQYRDFVSSVGANIRQRKDLKQYLLD